MSDAAIEVQSLYKRYSRDLGRSRRRGIDALVGEFLPRPPIAPDLQPGEFWALEDVSLQVGRGEAVGIVGANGAGKTSLLRVISGLARPDHGNVTTIGRTGAVLQLGASFEMHLTGRESIVLEGALLGKASGFTDSEIERVLDFAELGEHIDAPVRTYSQGMRLRLGYAIAAALDPAILLLDEELAVGDFGFQRKCMRYLNRFVADGGTLVIASHQLWELGNLCRRCIVLDRGRLVTDGDRDKAIGRYMALVDKRESDRRARADALRLECAADLSDGTNIRPDELGQASALAATVASLDGSTPVPGEPASLTIDVDVVETLPRFRWAFGMSRPGELAAAIGAESPLLPGLAPGRHRLKMAVPRWPLYSGTYELRLALYSDLDEVICESGLFSQPITIEVPRGATQVDAHAALVDCIAWSSMEWIAGES